MSTERRSPTPEEKIAGPSKEEEEDYVEVDPEFWNFVQTYNLDGPPVMKLSKNGHICICTYNVMFQEVTSEFILERLEQVMNKFPTIARLQIRFGLVLEQNDTLRYVFPSGNTCMDPDKPFYDLPISRRHRAIRKLIREIGEFDSVNYLDALSERMCEDSEPSPSAIAVLQFYGLLQIQVPINI